jgi:hypothetical protein
MYCIVSHDLTVVGCTSARVTYGLVMVVATLATVALATGQQGYRVKRISACGGCLGNDRR